MRRERKPSALRGLLLFLLGALVGANAVYFTMTRGMRASAPSVEEPGTDAQRIETPLPIDGVSPTTPPGGAVDTSTPVLPPPTVRVTGDATAATGAPGSLLLPVQGIT